jgi:hypothetical protein
MSLARLRERRGVARPAETDGLHLFCAVTVGMARWAAYLPMARIGVRDGSQILTAVLYYSWLNCSTPAQSTPTQYAGNIGAQPKDGMRGRRLSEVCCACFCSSAHRPAWCYMDWSNIHVQTQDVRACGCTPRHHDIHTPNNISPVLNPVCSLLHLTLGSSAKAI